LSEYDLDAPVLDFLDPWPDAPLQYNTMFRALQFEQDRQAHIVLLDEHPTTHRPFLCLRGIREYHEHPQHSGDEWLLYRNSMNMFSIVLAVWRVSIDLVQPVIIPQPNGVGINWNALQKP